VCQQFFLRSADADVEKYLKLLTFLPLPEIHQIMQEHQKDESKRIAQHKLASEFVELIHGLPAAQLAEEQHRKLHSKNMSISDLRASVAEAKATDMHPKTGLPMFAHPSLNKHAQPLHREDDPSTSVKLPRSLVFEKPMSRILWSAGLVTSRTEGQRLINAGGAYVGGGTDAKTEMGDNLTFTPVRTSEWKEVQKWILDDSLLILRSGKWRIKIVSIIPDEEYAALGLSCPGWEEHLQSSKSDSSSTSSTETETETKAGVSGGEVEWSPLRAS
jgi:tyrosyl-tRNA synthetase